MRGLRLGNFPNLYRNNGNFAGVVNANSDEQFGTIVEQFPNISSLPSASVFAERIAQLGNTVITSNGSNYHIHGGHEVTWANRPSPSVFRGFMWMTDIGIGGSLWRSDGIRWNLVGRATLFSGEGITSTSTDATTEALAVTPVIPMGVLYPGLGILVRLKVLLSAVQNTGSSIEMRLRITTNSNGVTDSLVIGSEYSIIPSIRQFAHQENITILSTTTARLSTIPWLATGYNISTGTSGTASYTIQNIQTNNLFISITRANVTNPGVTTQLVLGTIILEGLQ